jgi:hypothetical protein
VMQMARGSRKCGQVPDSRYLNERYTMRYVAICFCFTLGCHPPGTTAALPSARRASTLFTDSAIYRARCKEADSVGNLTMIPQKCTPRDQRLIVR